MRISALCCDSDSCVAEIEILSFTLIEPGVILILLLSTTLILQIGCHPKQGAGGVVIYSAEGGEHAATRRLDRLSTLRDGQGRKIRTNPLEPS